MSRKRDLRAVVVLVLVVLAGLLLGTSQQVDAMVPEDILTMRKTDVADLSPDGRFLLYTIGEWDTAAEVWNTSLFRRDIDTGEDLLIFTPAEEVRGAVYRPDGQAIAYLRTRDDSDEIWIMDADGGGRRQVSDGAGRFGSLQWSPDGSALAWITPAGVGSYEGRSGRYVVADGIGFRHLKQGYREGARRQLFVMDLANGESRRLVDEAVDIVAVDWSPDSRRLVFEAKAEADLGWNLNTDLWVVAREGGELRRLTANPGMDSSPQWFEDESICYLSTPDPLWESAPRTVAVCSPELGDGGPVVHHGLGFDNLFFRYAEAEGRFYVLGANRGCLDLIRVEDDRHTVLTNGRHDFWSVRIAGGRAVLTGASQTLPGAIFLVELENAAQAREPRVLVDPNTLWRAQVGLTEPEPFAVVVDGRTIEGWYFKPADLEEGQRAPTVLSIHGGPEWMYGGYFLPEFHILPRFGYGVVIANPTGSMGYGITFMKDIRGDWIDRPGRELLACLDHAVAAGWADPQRLAVMGGSYGGHLGAALTTLTDRFRAAALDRMYPEPISFWGTTDEKWFPEWEFMGRPWEAAAQEVYRRNSPFEQVGRVTTPTLISHGMQDYRCLVAGGEIWFSALQAQGVPTRFIRFENESHGIRHPANKVFYQNQLLDWFERHVLESTPENGSHD